MTIINQVICNNCGINIPHETGITIWTEGAFVNIKIGDKRDQDGHYDFCSVNCLIAYIGKIERGADK